MDRSAGVKRWAPGRGLSWGESGDPPTPRPADSPCRSGHQADLVAPGSSLRRRNGGKGRQGKGSSVPKAAGLPRPPSPDH